MARWKNIPPNKRPSWARMNEGQRRYAYEQYNLALVRRGLPISHPVPEGQGEYNHRGDFDIDQVINQPHPDEQSVAREIDNDSGDIDPSAEEVLANLPNAPEDAAQEFDEGLLESDNQGSDNPSGNSMADSTVGAKRGPEDQGGNASKKKGGAAKLPGTGAAQGSGNNLGEDSVRPYSLPKPTVTINSNINYYRKVHRFFSYGYAYKILVNSPQKGFQSMTTPLAVIPWDYLHFYVNPSEFALLPPQSSVQHVKVTVNQRNVRVAFPTNSSANALATLNQNKNIIYGVGLNKKLDSVPMRYTAFAEGQPMIPTAAALWTKNDWVNDMNNWYGSQNNTGGSAPVVPRHQTGQPDVLQHYLNMIYRTGDSEDGWQCLQTHTKEADADVTAGGTLVTISYSPAVGLCKPPRKNVQRAFNTGYIDVLRGSSNLQNHTTTVDVDINSVSKQTDTVTQQDQNFSLMNSPVQILEKSQIYNEGVFHHGNPQAQPSLHVGVQPTYALTSTNTSVNNSFTDTQAFFEVVSECWIDTALPTFRPLARYTNNTETNLWTHNINADNIQFDKPMYDGLYCRNPVLATGSVS